MGVRWNNTIAHWKEHQNGLLAVILATVGLLLVFLIPAQPRSEPPRSSTNKRGQSPQAAREAASGDRDQSTAVPASATESGNQRSNEKADTTKGAQTK